MHLIQLGLHLVNMQVVDFFEEALKLLGPRILSSEINADGRAIIELSDEQADAATGWTKSTSGTS